MNAPAVPAPSATTAIRPHPRTVGWIGTTSVAMGGINQSLFLLSALFIGQGGIPGQGSAAVVLLIVGLVLSWMATPGWTELILMYPHRVGGIAATCAEAFRPYSPVLANLTGVCYWWGWVPTCGLTALLAAGALKSLFFQSISQEVLATTIVVGFTVLNLCGVKWVMRSAIPIAAASASLAFLSAFIPIFSGHVNWKQAFHYDLTVPFPGKFGEWTSIMAGLYLVGFAAPAFEQAACHVGETIDPRRNVPRAMLASALLAALYFIVLPVVWLGTLGADAVSQPELAPVLGPTFAPLFGASATAAAVGFMVFNMLHGTLAPLAGAARTLSQLSEDGLLPEFLSLRSRTDTPWAATLLTAGSAIAFLWIGDPIWLVAAANLTYLIGIAMPNIAVWLLRRNEPDLPRPYRAPWGTITLGVLAAFIWGVTVILGFQQFGLRTVLIGIAFAYSGSVLYAWRVVADRIKKGLPWMGKTLHVKLTGAMLLVLTLDAIGYLIAVEKVPKSDQALIVILEDLFVAVALLTFSVGLILPGMIAHSAVEVSRAAEDLVAGTLADFTRAMKALAAGDLESAKARFRLTPVVVHSNDEVGDMAITFNRLQEEVGRAAGELEGARQGLLQARLALTQTNAMLSAELEERKRREIEMATMHGQFVEASRKAGMAEVATSVLHNVGNVLNSVNVASSFVAESLRKSKAGNLPKLAALLQEHQTDLAHFLAVDPRGRQIPAYLSQLSEHVAAEQATVLKELSQLQNNIEHIKEIVTVQQDFARGASMVQSLNIRDIVEEALQIHSTMLVRHDIEVQREFEEVPAIQTEKHKILQILINLLRNAKQACEATPVGEKRVVVRILAVPGSIRVVVEDSGIGIPKENLTRIFAHGFTTKRDGHGFGLHSGALTARELGGSLEVHSEGLGRGATFTLDLPLNGPGVAA